MVEGRHRLAEQRDDAQHRIPRPPARHRREHAGRDADGTRDGERRQRQLRPRACAFEHELPRLAARSGWIPRTRTAPGCRARRAAAPGSAGRARASRGTAAAPRRAWSAAASCPWDSPDRRTRKNVAIATPSSTGIAPSSRRSRKAATTPRPHRAAGDTPYSASRPSPRGACRTVSKPFGWPASAGSARGTFGTWAAASPGRKAAPAVSSSAVRREISVVSLPGPGGTRAAGCRRGSPRPRTC